MISEEYINNSYPGQKTSPELNKFVEQESNSFVYGQN